MEITHIRERQLLVKWGQQVQEIARQRGDEHAVGRIASAIHRLQEGRFTLAVMGKVKRGKSTLVNALLGRTDDLLAPIGKMPATSVITRFMVGDEQATVHFRDGQSENVRWGNVHSFVTETGNPENVKDVDCVDVTGAFSMEKDLCLIDTPGAGSMHKHHDAMLHGVLPQADAVIFLVTARMPIAADELELLQSLKAVDVRKVFFAINKVDASDSDEIEDGVEHNLETLGAAGVTVDKIYRISAKIAMTGDRPNSGLNALLSDISTHVQNNRAKLLHDNFRNTLLPIAQAVYDDLGAELEAAERNATSLQQELLELRTRQRELDGLCALAQRRFLHRWASAVDALAIDLTDAEDRVYDQIQAKVAAVSTVGVKSLVKKMPTLLVETIEREIQPIWSRCEVAMRDAAVDLANELPDLTLPRPGRTFVNAEGKAGMISSGISKGVVLASAGVGIHGLAGAATSAVTAALGAIPLGLGAGVIPAVATAAFAIATPASLLLIGVGSIGVISSYRMSRIGVKDELARACERQIRDVFVRLRTDRLNALRSLGGELWDAHAIETEARLESRRIALESALSGKDEADYESARCQYSQLQLLLEA